MMNKTLKNHIFRIIPEYSLLMISFKKIYGRILVLRSLFLKSVLDAHIFLFTVRNTIFKDKPVDVALDSGASFVLNCHGKEALYYWMNPDEKEYESSIIEKFLKPGMVFFDMGSCEGFFSLAVGASIKDAQIHSFEEEKEAFDMLKENIKINAFSKNISIHNQLPINNFDAFFQNANTEKIDLIRVCTKGNEFRLFENMEKILSGPDAPVIVYKTSGVHTGKFGYHPVEILWLLQDFGYSFFTPDAEGNMVERSPREYEGFIIAKKK
ncbi:MAG: hypothetical protein EXS48_00460 [Candidatus Staskawiczbacteria bacterium]|nr:hypothetical protein [Candidatus Staskawiczbacteria bacterium]